MTIVIDTLTRLCHWHNIPMVAIMTMKMVLMIMKILIIVTSPSRSDFYIVDNGAYTYNNEMTLLVDKDCCGLWGRQWLSWWWLPPSRSDVTSHVLSDALPVTEHGCGHRDLILVAWLNLYSLGPIDWARFHFNIWYITIEFIAEVGHYGKQCETHTVV